MSSRSESCPLCGGATEAHDASVVLGRIPADYVRCTSCGAVLAVDPTWLDEAYAEPINEEDSGLLQRCASMSERAALILKGERIAKGRFLDWGGGYGTFTRMMRDRGFEYYHDDVYCQNLFARGLEDEPGTRYDLVTAFEVFEHLPDPVVDLAAVAARTDRMLISTMLVDDPAPAIADWWYYGPEHGQHITLHTEKSLTAIGERLGFMLTSNGVNLHLFHRSPLKLPTRMMFSRAGRTARTGMRRAVAPVLHLGRGQ